MSFKAEFIADSSGKWSGNELRFETRGEAEAYAIDLACRWTLVTDWRVVESSDEPNQGDEVLLDDDCDPDDSCDLYVSAHRSIRVIQKF